MVNNILYRTKRNVVLKRLKTQNTGLYIIDVFSNHDKINKEENKKNNKDKDILFSFKLVNDYTHLINVTKDIHCSEGILYTEKKECVLPDEGDFNININEQNSFCREGKGYCQKESNNYICKCKSGYQGLYCEYSNDNATNMQIFQNTIDNFLNYMNESKNISIDKIVLVKEILYLINNTTIVPNEFILFHN